MVSFRDLKIFYVFASGLSRCFSRISQQSYTIFQNPNSLSVWLLASTFKEERGKEAIQSCRIPSNFNYPASEEEERGKKENVSFGFPFLINWPTMLMTLRAPQDIYFLYFSSCKKVLNLCFWNTHKLTSEHSWVSAFSHTSFPSSISIKIFSRAAKELQRKYWRKKVEIFHVGPTQKDQNKSVLRQRAKKINLFLFPCAHPAKDAPGLDWKGLEKPQIIYPLLRRE